ncbi:MAG: NAD(P)/FAD-dependent oxidoreductase [Pseudomonadota bacterium]
MGLAEHPSESYDVVVVGGGHNGLTAAGYLSRAGLRVKVLERRSIVGGAAVTEEFHPGFRNSMCSYTVSLLSPKVIKDLELGKFGLQITDRATASLILGEGGAFLNKHEDEAAYLAKIAETHPGDAERYHEFYEVLDAVADVLRDVVLDTPPNVGGDLLDLFRAGKLANRLRKLSPKLQREAVKLFTMSIADYLAAWFAHPLLLGESCYTASVGNMQSVYAPGSAYVLLHHAFGEVNGVPGDWGHAIGGMGAITQAMARSAQAHGCDIEIDAPVAEVVIEDGVARSVRLEDGRLIRAKAIAANVNPKLLFQRLIGREHLNPDFARQIDNFRCCSGTFRMNLALDGLPAFSCLGSDPDREAMLRGSTMIAASQDYVEQAYQDAVRLGWARKPVIEMFIPSLYDHSLAPPGKHVMSLFCQHFNPYLPDGRSWDEVKTEVVETIIDTVAVHAPDIRERIVGQVALSPLDLEREYGLLGGDIFHGCLHMDQLFAMRPVAEYADYRMPLANLYLCGSGAHPGGGVTGYPGHNAAREILKDFKRRRLAA